MRSELRRDDSVAGDSAAEDRREVFGRLAAAELGASYRLAARLLGDPGEAEDAVNDAVLRAWLGFENLRNRDSFRPWLTRIVVNTCRNSLARRRIVRIEPIEDLDPPAADPFEPGHARDAVARAIDCLSPEQRIVIVLRYWNEMSVDEIARLVGVPTGTVKWRLHAACRRLRGELARSGWEDAS